MDPKASAKSKRSHSQHGRRSHPTPSAPGSHKNKKPAQAKDSEQGGDHKPKSPRPRPPSLPSNWDRYEQDYELEGEQRESVTAGSKENKEALGETVVVKSKGADFRYLIEQARSQPQDEALWNAAETESSAPTIAVTDYLDGLGSMLLARGKGLLFSCADDSFVVDDTTTSNLEIPFLSLDLNALEAQLANLKASQRLFIEPEYFPEELGLEIRKSMEETGNKSSLTPPGSCATEESSARKDDFAPETSAYSAWSNKEGSSALRDDFAPETSASSAWSNKEKEMTHVAISRGDGASVSNAHGKTQPPDSHHRSAATKKPLSSDLSAAKTELDALLDSLGEIELSGSSGTVGQSSTNLTEQTKFHTTSSNLDSSHQIKNQGFVNGRMKSDDVDDAIDVLLAENQNFVPSYNSAKSNIGPLREDIFVEADSLSSKLLPCISSLDDSFNDLLAETSSFGIQKGSMLSRVETQHSVKESRASAISDTLSKALDDLDSLLDL